MGHQTDSQSRLVSSRKLQKVVTFTHTFCIHTIYQRKVDVDMLNALKSVLAS